MDGYPKVFVWHLTNISEPLHDDLDNLWVRISKSGLFVLFGSFANVEADSNHHQVS